MQKSSLKKISHVTAHEIKVRQVVLSLAMTIKELIENSLDASASQIDIKLKQHGLLEIEISDNGIGIPSACHPSVCLKNATSKIQKFEDLEELSAYGFRGEALNALCFLGQLKIQTCTQEDGGLGYLLEFGNDGTLLKTSRMAKSVGTSVIIENLFYKLPVRRKDFQNHVKREFSKALQLVQSYAIFAPRVRFVFQNDSKVALRTSGAEMKDQLLCLFGAKFFATLFAVDFICQLPQSEEDQDQDQDQEIKTMRVQGFVSKVNQGRTSGDRQEWAINIRPCTLLKFTKTMNEIFKAFSLQQFPSFFLHLQLPPNSFDVNVSPDKRILLIHNENQVLEVFRNKIQDFFIEFGNELQPLNSQQSIPSSIITKKKSVEVAATLSLENVNKKQKVLEVIENSSSQEWLVLTFKQLENLVNTRQTVTISTSSIIEQFKKKNQNKGTERENIKKTTEKTKDENCLQEEVSRRLEPKEFPKMKIIGQFNRGFILTLLPVLEDPTSQDLFIIDQHAGDEKYLFEKYFRELKIEIQTLVQPIMLHLSPAQKSYIYEITDILAKRGFQIILPTENDENFYLKTMPILNGRMFDIKDFEELLGLLTEHSFVGKDDSYFQCSKMKSILASKACRTAFMIGDALKKQQMRQIIDHMADLKQPWNCPHGRPTMRWLYRFGQEFN